VARPEVVERDLDAERGDLREHLGGARGVGHDHVLGDLELQEGGGHPAPGERGGDVAGQPGVDEVRAAQVDRHGQLEARGPPGGALGEREVEHGERERADEARLLGQGEEAGGREQPAGRVLPAHERLDADDAARAQLDLRLVVQDELLAVERAREVPEQREARRRVGVARGVVVGGARAAALGLVHRDVRALHERVGIRRVRGEPGDPDARLDVQRDPVVREGLGDRRADELRGAGRPVRGAAREQHGELVAAEAGDEAPVAHRARDARADLRQQPVARRVAQRVVELLEAVEVEQQEGEPAPGDRLPDPLLEEPAVRQPGERVVQRVVLALGGDPLELPLAAGGGLPAQPLGERGEPHEQQRADAERAVGPDPGDVTRGGRLLVRVGLDPVRRTAQPDERRVDEALVEPPRPLDAPRLDALELEADELPVLRVQGAQDASPPAAALHAVERAEVGGHVAVERRELRGRVGVPGGDAALARGDDDQRGERGDHGDRDDHEPVEVSASHLRSSARGCAR